jgi:transglutaminase-like putative cysteine protease
MRPPRLPLLAPLLTLLIAFHPAFGDVPTHDRWYVLRMQDRRAGWLHDTRKVEHDRVISQNTVHLEIRRAEQTVTVSVESEFVETADATPVSMAVTQRLGSSPTTERFVFGTDGVKVTTTSASGERESTRPLPEGKWLTPAGAAAFLRQRLAAGAQEITHRAIDPSSGPDPVLFTSTVLERTTVEAMGKSVPAIRWRVVTDTHPELATTEYVDEFGVPIRSETALGGIKVEIVLADKDLALSPLDAPELLVSTLVSPDRAIERPRSVSRASYRLSVPDGKVPALPFGGVQSVAWQGDGSVVVSIDTGRCDVIPDHDFVEDAQRLPSAMVTSDDPEVKKLAERGEGASDAERAESLRRAVHSFIQRKNLGVGFASAAEVARTRTGDCTEHAVLLAACLRARGIPARVVSGLVFVEEVGERKNVFGYHMWTQAHYDGCWRDLDATLSPTMKFDATHIALATSDLADGEATNALVSLVPLLGKLRIEVVSTEP